LERNKRNKTKVFACEFTGGVILLSNKHFYWYRKDAAEDILEFSLEKLKNWQDNSASILRSSVHFRFKYNRKLFIRISKP
jgi:hypothetical protein